MVNIMVQWMVTGLIALFHPFFISVIDLNHNPKDATMEISVRIFTDDFEKTLQKYSQGKVDIVHPANKQLLDKQISDYITKKIKLKINGQPVTPHYLGHEIQQESTWSYFEVPGISAVSRVDVDCTLLYDFETSQMNIFHVKAGGKEKSYKLDYPKNTTSFSF